MVNTCDTCKWWGAEPYGSYIESSTGNIKQRVHHDCTCPKLRAWCDEDGLADNADYDYGLSTGPKFGCIHHEPK